MKSIVIVGGSSGIGLATVQNLLGKECEITNISRTPCAASDVVNITANVTDKKELYAAINAVDRIDALIYCAGASLAAPIEYVKTEDIEYVFDVNMIGAIECIKAAMPKLHKSDSPKIVLLSSAGGVAPIAFDGFYSAAKAGLFALAVAVRLECPKIKCTAVAVPATQTEFSFERKIYTDCGDYNAQLKSASDSLIKMEQTGYSAEYVGKRVAAILQKRNPPPKVTIGTKNKLMLFAYNILPWRLKLYALRKIYDL
ncbi:MAG: SDR family NAD(P)-dependent oxidoreductase [Clostridiales bacterium]|nr:SDR family NAD(P)-dependent oxidoreductase [Clostridiales bacterium]